MIDKEAVYIGYQLAEQKTDVAAKIAGVTKKEVDNVIREVEGMSERVKNVFLASVSERSRDMIAELNKLIFDVADHVQKKIPTLSGKEAVDALTKLITAKNILEGIVNPGANVGNNNLQVNIVIDKEKVQEPVLAIKGRS